MRPLIYHKKEDWLLRFYWITIKAPSTRSLWFYVPEHWKKVWQGQHILKIIPSNETLAAEQAFSWKKALKGNLQPIQRKIAENQHQNDSRENHDMQLELLAENL